MAANDHMRRASLYVGDLHPEVTEKDLTETFSRVGPLLSVHLCRDKYSRNSLRYAYVNFWLPCHAFTALQCLNHTILRGKSMRIMWNERGLSVRKYGIGNLFVKNLDKSITSARLQTIFSNYGTILSCKVTEENGISRGFGFVQFDSEDSAMAALAALHDTELEGKILYVSKFQKKTERKGAELGLRSDKFSEQGKVSRALNFDSHEAVKTGKEIVTGELSGSTNQVMESKSSNLFVKNLDASVDDKILEVLFRTYGKVISANVVRAGGVSRGFGFVCFASPDDAKKALLSLSGANFEGRTLYVAMAWPKKQENRHFYSSSEKFPPQPLNTSNYYPCLSSPIPFEQPIPLYRHFISPFNSSNLVQAQNFRGTFYALPMNLATSGAYGQGKYLEMSKGQLAPSILQGKIINGDRKELCKGLVTTKTFCLGSSPEIYKTRPGFTLQTIQPMQIGKLNGQQRYLEMRNGQNPSSTLQEKLNNGDGKEPCKGSGSVKSSPEIGKMNPVHMPCPPVQNLQARYDSQETLKSPQIQSDIEKAVQV